MFEYLMPRLLLRSYSGTLLDESCGSAVDRQIEYGQQHRTPWGVSESAFSALDAALDYQYQAFGVPGLGLKRGLVDNLVIAPYATAMALMVAPLPEALKPTPEVVVRLSPPVKLTVPPVFVRSIALAVVVLAVI